MRTRLYWR